MKRSIAIAASAAGGLAAVVSAVACRPGRASELPEPTYQEPPLPQWEPPEPDEPVFDPMALEGEWVTDEPEESPSSEKSLDLGAGGAQNSSTEAPERATVRPPKSD